MEFSIDRLLVLKNRSCPYCGSTLIKGTWNKDHVIGRRFVPKGTLTGWNLVVRSCIQCNQQKSALESDISAITMAPDIEGRYRSADPRIALEAKRKSSAKSVRTGRPVGASHETFNINGSIGAASISVQLKGPAQASAGRTRKLATMHIQAFAYWLTYDAEAGEGGTLGDIRTLTSATKYDWGNSDLTWFMEETANWDVILHSVAAEGFFKVFVRRAPGQRPLWSWALEWNGSTRIVGFMGDDREHGALEDRLPPRAFDWIEPTECGERRWRRQVALADCDDTLFSFDAAAHQPSVGSQSAVLWA